MRKPTKPTKPTKAQQHAEAIRVAAEALGFQIHAAISTITDATESLSYRTDTVNEVISELRCYQILLKEGE